MSNTTSRRLVREAERARITGIPRATWYAMARKGLVPKSVELTKQTRAWVEGELYEFNEARIAERDTA